MQTVPLLDRPFVTEKCSSPSLDIGQTGNVATDFLSSICLHFLESNLKCVFPCITKELNFGFAFLVTNKHRVALRSSRKTLTIGSVGSETSVLLKGLWWAWWVSTRLLPLVPQIVWFLPSFLWIFHDFKWRSLTPLGPWYYCSVSYSIKNISDSEQMLPLWKTTHFH